MARQFWLAKNLPKMNTAQWSSEHFIQMYFSIVTLKLSQGISLTSDRAKYNIYKCNKLLVFFHNKQTDVLLTDRMSTLNTMQQFQFSVHFSYQWLLPQQKLFLNSETSYLLLEWIVSLTWSNSWYFGYILCESLYLRW